MALNDLPIKELALLYLEHHHDDLNTPEDYINAFNYVHSVMSTQLKQMQKEPVTIDSIPAAAYGNVRRSQWKI